MTKILLSGYNGKMGRAIIDAVSDRDDCQIICGVDLFANDSSGIAHFSKFEDLNYTPDVVIDFSNTSNLESLLAFSIANRVPAVICTTGFSQEQVQQIKVASKHTPIFFSGNMSLGINLIIDLSKKAAAVFGGDFDIEIVEKHHNQKLDAPSGTALMIADALSEVMENEPQYTYDRHSYRKKRAKNEIGIHSVRGGTIVGVHEVIFAGRDEILTITHEAHSKEVFAIGAINAAIYIKGKAPGLYDMTNLLKDS